MTDYYQMLNPGDLIKDGDEYKATFTKNWIPYKRKGFAVGAIGGRVGETNRVRRPVDFQVVED